MSKQKEKGYRLEKAIASYFNGERKGTLGKEDVAHRIFSIECKVKNPIPKSATKDHIQATNNAPRGKIPIVVWHEDHSNHDDDFVIIKALHLREILHDNASNSKGNPIPNSPSVL